MPATSPSLGEFLRHARERRGFTLEGLAYETKIPQRHLEALERDNLSAIPAPFYRRAEVRAYARAVGLDQGVTLARLESASKPVVVPAEAPGPPAPRLEPATSHRYLIALGVVAVVAVVFGRAITERMAAPASRTGTGGVASQSPPAPSASQVSTDAKTLPQSKPLDRPERADKAPVVASGPNAVVDAAAGSPVTELVVTTDPPGARVTVNGIGWGLSPVTIRFLPPGEKRIRVSLEGYAAIERVFSVRVGQRQALEISMDAAP
jgi:cytoskeletal protein RodZ